MTERTGVCEHGRLQAARQPVAQCAVCERQRRVDLVLLRST
jgi:hypothetical protein